MGVRSREVMEEAMESEVREGGVGKIRIFIYLFNNHHSITYTF